MTSYLIVGGGVAGLVTAWELATAGHQVTLLEADHRFGGAVSRHRIAGLDLDAGAESFALTGGHVTGLLTDLGLESLIAPPNPAGAWVRHRRGSAPLPAGGLLGIPPQTFDPAVRRVIGTTGAIRASFDSFIPRAFGRSMPTLGGVVRTRMGKRVLERLVEPVAGGVYSADPDQLELATINPALAQALAGGARLADAVRQIRGDGSRPGSAVNGIIGGMYTLVEALTAAIGRAGGRLLAGQAVAAVTATDTTVRIQTTSADLSADRLVLAVPSGTVEQLLGRAVPALPTSDVLLATMVLDHPGLDTAPRGTGVLVSSGVDGVVAKALTHATAKWEWLAGRAGPHRHVLRLSYGRGGEPLPDPSELPELARLDAESLLGVDISPESVVGSAIVRWASVLPRPTVGHADAIHTLRAALPDRVSMVGGAVAGTGLAAVIADARRTASTLAAVTA